MLFRVTETLFLFYNFQATPIEIVTLNLFLYKVKVIHIYHSPNFIEHKLIHIINVDLFYLLL